MSALDKLSGPSCPFSSSQSIKIEQDDENSPSRIIYTFSSGLKITSYLHGNGSPNWGEQKVDYADSLSLEDRIGHIHVLFNKTIHHTLRPSLLEVNQSCILSQCTHPETQQILFRFPRHAHSVLNPVDSPIWRKSVNNLGISLSMLALKVDGSKLIDNLITSYFNKAKQDINNWIERVEKHFLKPWVDRQQLAGAYERFSSMNWYLCSHIVLGIPKEDYVDYAYVWNRLFQPNKGWFDKAIKIWTKVFSLDRCLRPYILQAVRNERIAENSLLHSWRENNLAQQVINTLSGEDLNEGERIAQQQGMTLEEKCLVDNAIGVMLGMQETVSYTLTEFLFQLKMQPTLKEKALSSDENLNKVLFEIMRVFPAAGSTRQWAFDSEVITSDQQRYEFKKGDVLGVHPIYVAHHPDIFSNSLVYDPERSNQDQMQLFGAGPNACPGRSFALPWIRGLLKHILERYEWSVTCPATGDLKKVQHSITFTTRQDPPLQIGFWRKDSGEPHWKTPLEQIIDELDEHYIS